MNRTDGLARCFGSGQLVIRNINTPEAAECRDCASTVATDARGLAVRHLTGDRDCWSFADREGSTHSTRRNHTGNFTTTIVLPSSGRIYGHGRTREAAELSAANTLASYLACQRGEA